MENNAKMHGSAFPNAVGLALRVPIAQLWKLHWLLVNGDVLGGRAT